MFLRLSPAPALLKNLAKCCEQFSMNGVNEIMDILERSCYDRDNDLVTWLREKADISDFASIAVRIENYL